MSAIQLKALPDDTQARIVRCTLLHQQGQHAELLREAPGALRLLREQTLPNALPQHTELLRMLVISANELGQFDVALDAAHEQVRLAVSHHDDAQALAAALALAATFERMGDSWQAVRLLSQAVQDHGHGAPDRPLLIALNGLCAISLGVYHRMAGAMPAAEVAEVLDRGHAAGQQARALLADVADPVYEVTVLGNLGEVLLHRGDLMAAHDLLQGAHAQAVQRGLASHAWRIAASMGAWLLASGRPADALVAMHKLLAQVGDTGPRQTVVRANHAAYQALRQLGRFDEALWHFEVVERLERERTIQQMQAQSVLFVTRAEAQRAQWQAEHAQQDARTQRERAAAFAQSAERDPLAGLGNRRHLDRRCAELLATAQMSQQPLTVVLLDIDHFKAVNDTHGHAVGDAVLLQLAQLLRDNTRAADVLARYGGEEFVMVLPGMGLQRATEVCERLRQRLAAIDWAVWGVHGRGVTVSMGLAAVPAYDAALLLQRADEALYRAKRGGRNRLEWAPATA